MTLEMLTCDYCSGKSALCGLMPRKGMTREELIQRVKSKGHVNVTCQHCGRVSTLRKIERKEVGV